MTTLDDLKLRRETLTAQRSSGVARVSYDGKSIDYRSVAEIDRENGGAKVGHGSGGIVLLRAV